MTATNRPPILTRKLAVAWPAVRWREVTVLVAVSGGADSVALARALVELRQPDEGRLVLAHYNHRLRGPESDSDQAFVAELGRQLGLEVMFGARGCEGETGRRGDGTTTASEGSLRAIRYEFLASAASQCGARYVATAHTADDQVETVLLNLLRGTGLAGLAGIPRVRQLTPATTLIRPLLDVARAEVLEYLAQRAQQFRDDSSNANTDYTRNRIRHELLPLLARDYNPQVRDAITRLSRLAGEADDEINGLAADLAAQHVRTVAHGVELPAAPLAQLSGFMARSLLRAVWQQQGWPEQEMGQSEWDELLVLACDTNAPPCMFPGGIRAVNGGDTLRLTQAQSQYMDNGQTH